MNISCDLFVSHSQDDSVRVKDLTTAWDAAGIRVFVDYDDPVLVDASRRGAMSAADIERLREAIIQCHVFVFVASRHSVGSGWMPWELGLAHGAVGRVHICELDEGALEGFSEREYMRLYEGAVFSPGNAISHLEAAVEQARREAVTPARHAQNARIGEMIAEELLKGHFADAQGKLSQRAIGDQAGTIEGGLGHTSESIFDTKRS